MEKQSVAVLILAGGKIGPDLASVAGDAPCRALIDLAGRPMLHYVLDAVRGGLEAAGVTGRILLAGDDVPPTPGCEPVAGGASLVDTLLNGVACLTSNETRLLLVTADIPFLTAASVADFLTRAERDAPGAQFVYPIIEADKCRAAFPDMKRTTLRIAEGEFTGGNVSLLDPSFLREKADVIRAAYANRKNVTGLAVLLGPSFLFRLVASRAFPAALPLPLLEKAVGRLLGGAVARAVVTPFPEIGSDVDRTDDVLIARRLLAGARQT